MGCSCSATSRWAPAATTEGAAVLVTDSASLRPIDAGNISGRGRGIPLHHMATTTQRTPYRQETVDMSACNTLLVRGAQVRNGGNFLQQQSSSDDILPGERGQRGAVVSCSKENVDSTNCDVSHGMRARRRISS